MTVPRDGGGEGLRERRCLVGEFSGTGASGERVLRSGGCLEEGWEGPQGTTVPRYGGGKGLREMTVPRGGVGWDSGHDGVLRWGWGDSWHDGACLGARRCLPQGTMMPRGGGEGGTSGNDGTSMWRWRGT
ncbi:hypothetical protein H5410_006404 [Solanum commersonii]|uniref:Uncharacterized protein n=1 Tax=Solanum commersonii TaxID=4109 RepID=A0A9J6AAC6_SOLCO|nr:hypothetical protein H5410_006404 [Solanum commersonii]